MATLACGLNLGRSEPSDVGEEAPRPQATEAPPAEAPPSAAEATSQPTDAPGGEAPPPATQVPPEATEAPPASAGGDSEEAELDLNMSVSGLQNLGSYRTAFRFGWNGT